MTASLVVVVLGIALVDSINPSAIAMTSYLVARPDPWSVARAYIAGIFALYLTAGLIVVFLFDQAIDRIVEQLSSPAIPNAIEALIGIAALAYALGPQRSEKRNRPTAPANLTPIRAFGLGLTITAVEGTTALPYLGALGAIARSNIHPAAVVVLLLAYNTIFIAPPLALTQIARRGGSDLLKRMTIRSDWQTGTGRLVLRVLCGLIGLILLLDAGLYFFADTNFLPG